MRLAKRLPHPERAGLGLVELALSSVLVVMVMSSVFFLGNSTSSAFTVAMSEVRLIERVGVGVAVCADRLRRAGTELLVLDASAGVCQLDYQVASGYDEGTSTTLWQAERLLFEDDPADPVDGNDNDGDGLVDEGRVVHVRLPDTPGERRSVVVTDVLRAGIGETAGNAVDDDGDGVVDEPGFNLTLLDERVFVELTVQARLQEGQWVERTLSRSIGLKN